jgi:hypothetical protein
MKPNRELDEARRTLEGVEATSLEELLADRLACEVARIAEERIKAMFPFAEQEPSDTKEIMDAREAAELLRLPYSSFREIAPTLPRHAVTSQRFVYIRKELLEWLLVR